MLLQLRTLFPRRSIMGIFKVKRILGSKPRTNIQLQLNTHPSPARPRSRPRLDKSSLLGKTRPVPLPFSLPLIANVKRRRAGRCARPSAASFFHLYEDDGQPPHGVYLATRVAVRLLHFILSIIPSLLTDVGSQHVSAVSGSSNLEDDVKNSQVLSLVADVTDGRANDPSFFGVCTPLPQSFRCYLTITILGCPRRRRRRIRWDRRCTFHFLECPRVALL